MHRGCVSTSDSDAGIFYLGVDKGEEAAGADTNNEQTSSNPAMEGSVNDTHMQHRQHDSRPPKNVPSR